MDKIKTFLRNKISTNIEVFFSKGIFEKMLATIENNHYESGENHQKKSKRKSHYYNNSKGSTIVLANNAQKIGANE